MKVSLLLLSLCLLLSTVGYTQAKSSLDLVLGADSGYRYLGTDGESADIVANVRNEKEAAMPGWRVGGSYNKRVGDGLYLRTGVRYVKTGYRIREQRLVFSPQSDGMGGVIPIVDPSLPQSIAFTNRYHFLEVPLAVRKEWPAGSKTNFFAEAGIAPSYLLAATYKLTTDLISEASTPDADFNRLQLLGTISVGLSYSLTDRLELFGQPSFRYHLTRLLDAPVREHLLNAGLELGIRKSLGGTQSRSRNI